VRNSAKYITFLSIFAILGFSREFFFVNINSQLYSLYYNHTKYHLPTSLQFLAGLDYATLYFLKFPFTLLCVLAYFITSYFAVKCINHNKKNTIWVVYIYALLLVLSGMAMAYNYFFKHQLSGDEYTFSRWLMGIAQSPLVAFFIIASGKLYHKFQTDQKHS
jgi:hypothetical protein